MFSSGDLGGGSCGDNGGRDASDIDEGVGWTPVDGMPPSGDSEPQPPPDGTGDSGGDAGSADKASLYYKLAEPLQQITVVLGPAGMERLDAIHADVSGGFWPRGGVREVAWLLSLLCRPVFQRKRCHYCNAAGCTRCDFTGYERRQEMVQ